MNGQEAAGAVLGVACFVLIIVLVIYIFYLLTLQKALSRVSPQNRMMEPGMVWLMLVPCVNIVWQFLIATRVPASLKNEFRDRGQDDGSDYGKGIALAATIIGLFSTFVSWGGQAAAAGGGEAKEMGGIITWGFWILIAVELALSLVFWVKVASYSKKLASGYGRDYPDDYDRRFDEYDDSGRRSPRGGGSAEPPPETIRPEDGGQYK